MMIRDRSRLNPTVRIPPFDCNFGDDHVAHVLSPASHNGDISPHYEKALAALQRYLPSNKDDAIPEKDGGDLDDFDFPMDAFSCDGFRMFEFKVKKCSRARPHDWTDCPFAHPGEKARRRDPRKFHYSGTACPDFRKGSCKRGDGCPYAHGVFECWLHPARYRTQPCKDGTHCRRRVCFFAHTPDQHRVLPYSSPDGSPCRLGFPPDFGCSPRAKIYSPPTSPSASPPASPSQDSLSQLAESFIRLQLNDSCVGMGMGMSPQFWSRQMGVGLVSPRGASTLRAGCMSLPSTPNGAYTRSSPNAFNLWETSGGEEPAMERVESGRELRERIYAKLSLENSLDRVDPNSGYEFQEA